MIKFLTYIISSFIMGSVALYSLNKLNKDATSKIKNLIIIVVSTLGFYSNSFIDTLVFLRPVFLFILFLLINKLLYKNNFFSSVTKSIIILIAFLLSEILYVIVAYVVNLGGIDMAKFSMSNGGILLTNVTVALLVFIASFLGLIQKLYSLLYSAGIYLKKHQIAFLIFISFLSIVFLFYPVYFHISNVLIVYVATIIIFAIYGGIIIIYFKATSDYEKIKSKYTLSIENLKSYEEMLDQYRVAIHENKNQLLLVRNLSKDSKVKEYIDELIDNKEKDDSNVYNSLKRIPDSSIRAVIYSKILLMNNKQISYSMHIDRKISSIDFSTFSSKLSLDICNILNIFIDNAIEEVINLDKKQVLIEFTKSNSHKLEITISNTCKNRVNLGEIYGMGYSTKGVSRGFGLPIVKRTIEENHGVLENKTERINDVFVQYLYINIK